MQMPCDEDISDGQGILCNAALVDGGDGVGAICPLCDLRDENAKLKERLEKWEERLYDYVRQAIKEECGKV